MSTISTLEVPQDILDSARLTIPELKVEIAVYLYAQGRLSMYDVGGLILLPGGGVVKRAEPGHAPEQAYRPQPTVERLR